MLYGNDLILGHAGGDRPLRITRDQRAMHLYMVGATGTGKSKQIESCVRQDIAAWPKSRSGLMLLDLHGSLYDAIMDWTIGHDLRHLPLCPIDLRRSDWIVAYNPLRPRPEAEADTAVVIAGFVRAIAHAWGASDLSQTPRLAKWLRVMLATLYEQRATLGEVLLLIRSPAYRARLAEQVKDPVAQSVWQMSGAMKEDVFQEQVESTVNRVVKFLSTQVMRATLCQTGVSLDLTAALSRGAIIPVCLATRGSRIDEEDAITFGSVLLSDLWTAAQSRGKTDSGRGGAANHPFYLYLDEFQEYVTPVMARTLDQARGFNLHITLAHQTPSQLLGRGDHGRQVFDSVMANARTKIVFQSDHPTDLPLLAQWLFRNDVDVDQIKYQGYSTKVVGHELQYMESNSVSETDGTNESENWSDTASESTTIGTSASTTESEAEMIGRNESYGISVGRSVGATNGWSTSDTRAFGSNASTTSTQTLTNGRSSSAGDTESSSASVGISVGRSVSRSLGDPSDGLRDELDEDEEDYDSLLDVTDGGGGALARRDPEKAERLDQATRRVAIGQTWAANGLLSNGRAHSNIVGRSSSDGRSTGTSHGTNESLAHSDGRSRNSSVGSSFADSLTAGNSTSLTRGLAQTIGTTESETTGTAHSEGGSRGTSRAVTKGVTRSPMLLPILGREASTPVYRSVEEQLFMATQRIAGQPQRHCTVRLVGMPKPIAIVTPTVRAAFVVARWRDRWMRRLYQRLPCAIPMADALRRIAERASTGDKVDEPFTHRRVLPARAGKL